MGFICLDCIKEKGWPEPPLYTGRSYGPCEICKCFESCYDI